MVEGFQSSRVFPASGIHATQTGLGVGMAGEHERCAPVLALRVGESAKLEVEISELSIAPRLRFGIVGARRVGGHLHGLERSVEVALDFVRVRHPSVGLSPRAQRDHLVVSVERALVVTELEIPVTQRGVVPRVTWRDSSRTLGRLDRGPEAMLREQDGCQHAQSAVVRRILVERRPQRVLRFDRQRAVSLNAGLSEQGARQCHRGARFPRRGLQMGAPPLGLLLQIFPRRRRSPWCADEWIPARGLLGGVPPARVHNQGHEARQRQADDP